MKQYILYLFYTFSTALTYAQNDTLHFCIGLRDTRYLQIEYTIGHHFPIQLEHSLYSDKLKLQHYRVSAGYSDQFFRSRLYTGFRAYWGGIWRGNYQDYGAFLTLGYCFDSHQRYQVAVTLNPHYDTGLDYKTCFSTEALVGWNDVGSFVMEYSTIPEFRQSEERIRLGIDIHFWSSSYGCLAVRPLISIPIHQRYEKIRLHVNFNYMF